MAEPERDPTESAVDWRQRAQRERWLQRRGHDTEVHYARADHWIVGLDIRVAEFPSVHACE